MKMIMKLFLHFSGLAGKLKKKKKGNSFRYMTIYPIPNED